MSLCGICWHPSVDQQPVDYYRLMTSRALCMTLGGRQRAWHRRGIRQAEVILLTFQMTIKLQPKACASCLKKASQKPRCDTSVYISTAKYECFCLELGQLGWSRGMGMSSQIGFINYPAWANACVLGYTGMQVHECMHRCMCMPPRALHLQTGLCQNWPLPSPNPLPFPLPLPGPSPSLLFSFTLGSN